MIMKTLVKKKRVKARILKIREVKTSKSQHQLKGRGNDDYLM